MANFRWLNLSLFGPANTSGSTSVTSVTSSATSNVLNPDIYGSNGLESFVFKGTADVNTPSAAVSASGSQVTDSSGLLFTNSSANNFTLGLVVQFTTSTTLPTGISAATNYYVVPISSTTYKVATSLANALAGTVVAYTDTGTGNQTATPVAIAGASIYLQGSNDNEATWVTVPNTSTSITADASFVVEVDYVRYAAYRAKVALTTGSVQFTELQIGYRG